MTQANVTALRANLAEFLSRVERGEELEIVRHGKVIARLLPAQDATEAADARIRALRATARLGDVVSPTGESWESDAPP